jgi:5-methyltetrahydrofolate--homocysteine methyltransferase
MAEALFNQQIKNKILVLDGAMGTMIQQANLTADDFGGEAFEGCNEYLVETAPQVIERIHRAYLESGADIIETNTFGGTRLVLDEYDLGHLAEDLNIKAAQIARRAADAFSTPQWPRFVAGSMGPTTKTLSVTGGTTFDDLVENYREQAVGLIKGGVDVLLLETSQDMLNVKAGFIGIKQAFNETETELPLLVSGTIEPMGTTLAGQSIEAFYLSLEHMQPACVGLNCATGPEFMTDHLRSLSDLATTYVSCYPNAGLPDEEGQYHESPESLAKKIEGFIQKGWLNLVGGCCGTTPEHIKAIAEVAKQYTPRQPSAGHAHAVSGIEPLLYDDSMRPLFVGERTNVSGSRKFKRLIKEGKFEEASEIARAQVKNGAHVIDINLQDTEIDEAEAMQTFLSYITKMIKVPLMIDSTYEHIIEIGLKNSQGKGIINSINLEDGEEKFEKVVPLIHQYGAAVVVILIDERGQAVSREAKLEVAHRSYDLLVNKYKLNPEDIIFDPNMFPIGSGDPQYIGSAVETIEGIKLIKEQLPKTKTILGLSNISFGLPEAGREVLNAVYLYHCTKAGLDYVIVNTEKLQRYASIPEQERTLAEDLIFNTSDETLAKFVAFYRDKKVEKKEIKTNLSLEERLAEYIIEGTKEGLLPDLEDALQKYPNPLDIINGPLMAGMAEVGRLFNDNQLIVAEVLQSAEVMKASVAFLEPHMEKNGEENASHKGKIILATVKGDVHDIGKNLVEIILSNNGFKVVDLGIKVAPNTLIEAIQKEKPDAVGLSGLLVKSAQQMVLTAHDLKQSNISIPILVGGAALSRSFTDNKISPEYEGIVLYAKDAMDGLALANKLQDNNGREQILLDIAQKKEARLQSEAEGGKQQQEAEPIPTRSNVSLEVPVFVPADLEPHILRDYNISFIEPYINWQMLLGHHLGIKGKISRLLEEKDAKTLELKEIVQDLLSEAKKEAWIKTHASYRFYPAQAEGNDVIIYDPRDKQTILQRFHFPRQNKAPYLCLADYLRPKESGEMDYVAFFAVTAGSGIREKAQEWKEKGDYLRSHAIQALALELAEGFAERIHQVIRDKWGFPDTTDFTMQDRFGAKYQGQRYSFGYPACPDLEDQVKLFKLIKPEEIGIELTEGFMMEPEASVTAMVFAHPEARYFNVQI